MSNANEPAYPVADFQRQDGEIQWGRTGMTKREAFAMHIMADNSLYCYDADRAAEIAVHRADALLAELAKGEK